jgi:hypothetical protein
MMNWNANVVYGQNKSMRTGDVNDLYYAVLFHTNLDLHPAEKLPEWLPCRPIVGDRITSLTKWKPNDPSLVGGERQLTLEVVSVELCERGLRVELHLPKGMWESLHTFYKQSYEKWTGRWFI